MTENHVKISCKDVWKVFGNYSPELFDILIDSPEKAGESELTSQCTVAVREANIDILKLTQTIMKTRKKSRSTATS